MTAPPTATAPVLLDADQRVAIDLPCRGCGYNLRSLPYGGVCPECAHSVEASTLSRFLKFASPDWLKRVTGGFKLLLASLASLVFTWVVLMFASMVVFLPAAMSNRDPAEEALAIMGLIVVLIGLASLALFLIGAVRATSPEPGVAPATEGRSARRVLRAALWACGAAVAAGIVLLPLGAAAKAAGLTGPMSWLIAALHGLAALLGAIASSIVLPLAGVRYCAALLDRVPRPGLVRFSRVLFWAYLVSAGLTVAGYAFMIAMLVRSVAVMAPPVTTGPAAGMPGTLVATSASNGGGTVTWTVPSSGSRWPTTSPGSSSAAADDEDITGTAGSSVEIAMRPAPIGGAGPTLVTTFPTSAPVFTGPPPAFMALAVTMGLVSAVCGFVVMACSVAGIVLLVMTYRALKAVLIEAEAIHNPPVAERMH